MFDLPYILTHPLLASIVKRCALLSTLKIRNHLSSLEQPY